jgi:sugar (pentulose or hexulose) kinase
VRVPRVTEVSVLGAALLAGIGVGVISDLVEGVAKLIHSHHDIRPRHEYTKRYNHMFHLYRQLYVSLSPVFKEVAMFDA